MSSEAYAATLAKYGVCETPTGRFTFNRASGSIHLTARLGASEEVRYHGGCSFGLGDRPWVAAFDGVHFSGLTQEEVLTWLVERMVTHDAVKRLGGFA